MRIRTSPSRRSASILGALVLGALTLPAATASAQQSPNTAPSAWEVRPFVGALIPTGDHGDLLKSAVLVGAEVGWQFHPNVAVTGTFGWAPSSDKTLAADDAVDLFQYDLGIEGRLNDLVANPAWSLRPYGRIGAGARTYDHRDLDTVDAQTSFVGHGALGLDIARETGRIGLRLEARDNVSAFEGLRGELPDSETRNDVQLTAGLTIRL